MDLSKTRSQLIVLILYTLDQIGASGSRQEVIQHIAKEGWFARVDPEDSTPYPSEVGLGRNEPRWQVLMAWARSAAVNEERPKLVDGSERDCWRLTRKGRECLNAIKQSFESRENRAESCYMWSRTFKGLIDPHYQPGHDTPRLGSIYLEMENFLNPVVRRAIQLLEQRTQVETGRDSEDCSK